LVGPAGLRDGEARRHRARTQPCPRLEEKPLSFLTKLPDLTELQIIDFNLDDVSPVHDLHKLKSLQISTYCKSEIDFRQFPHLEDVALEWRPKAKSLYECTSLKRIFINRWSGRSFEGFGRTQGLRKLSLKGSRLERIGQVSFPHLEELEIALAVKLASLEGVETLRALKSLWINTCKKIDDLSPISSLTGLESVHFCNCGDVPSLKPLLGLHRLRQFLFYESTNVLDGDLEVLKRLPRLESIAFQQRRHYNCKRADFPEGMA